MAFDFPFSNRLKSNRVYITETGIQLNGKVGVVDSDPIILDATKRFSRRTKASVSDNPVADRTDRADHYRGYNPVFEFEGVVSNDGVSALSYNPLADATRSQQYVERINRIIEEKRVVTIYMPDGLAAGRCLITSFDVSRDKNWSNGFYISITAKQIQVLTSAVSSTPRGEDLDLLEALKNAGDTAGASTELNRKTVITLSNPPI